MGTDIWKPRQGDAGNWPFVATTETVGDLSVRGKDRTELPESDYTDGGIEDWIGPFDFDDRSIPPSEVRQQFSRWWLEALQTWADDGGSGG